MKARLDALAARRDALAARAGDQRLALASAAAVLLPQGAGGQALVSLAQFAKRHRVVAAVAAAVAGVFLVRRRRAALWLGRGLMAWRAWQMIRTWLKPAR